MPNALLSRSISTLARDSKGRVPPHSTGLLLAGKDTEIDLGGNRYLLDTLSDRQWWQAIASLAIGHSVLTDMAPALVAAFVQAARLVAGHELPIDFAGCWKKPHGDFASAPRLGGWLLSQAGKSDGDVQGQELRYFTGSGGAAAHALTTLIEHNFPRRRFSTILDIGSGIGFIPFLLTLDPRFAIESAILVEPLERYRSPALSLWSEGGTSSTVSWQQSDAESYGFDMPADLVMARHCLFRIKTSSLPGVFERAWAALRPGGLLVICEIPTDEADPKKLEGLTAPLLQRTVLLDMLTRFGRARLYLGRDRWSKPCDPFSVAAKDYRSDGFLVLEKPR